MMCTTIGGVGAAHKWKVYGKIGNEYNVPVSLCSITMDHFKITCKTVAGAGKVKITSSTGVVTKSNEVLFSYDPPKIRLLTAKWAEGGGESNGLLSVTVIGNNFGKDSSCGTLDVVGHSWVIMQSPPGYGKDLDLVIQVGNQKVSVKYSYQPPTVASLSPLRGPTSGLTLAGQPIVMTVIGTNFGVGTVPGSTQQPYEIIVNGTEFREDSYTKLAFYMPEGYGVGARVSVRIGNQQSSNDVKFDYSEPVLTKVTSYCGSRHVCKEPLDRFETDSCTDIALWEDYTEWQGRLAAAGAALATGDDSVYSSRGSLERKCGYDNDRWQMAVIEGSSLGSKALAQAGAPLSIFVSDEARGKTVGRAGQTCAGINPIEAACENDDCLEPISKAGFYRLTVDISCNKKSAPDDVRECRSSPDKDLNFVDWVRPEEAKRAMGTNTIPDANGTKQQGCDEARWSPMTNPAKYKRENRWESLELFDYCYDIVGCHPKEACIGDNRNPKAPKNNETLTKEASPFFTKGYYRLNNKCEQCPENPEVLIALFFLAVVGVCIGGWFLNKKNFNVAFISIGIDYFQVLALFARSEIQWPDLMRKFFEFCSLFNFNIDITAPECLVPNLDYTIKWVGIMALPVGAAFLLICMFFVKIAVQRCNGKRENICKQFSSVIALYLMAFYYLYLAVTRRALDIFNCNPSIPYDGYYYTEFTSIDCEGGLCKCYIEGSLQSQLQLPAGLLIVLYLVGFPAFVAYAILRNKSTVVTDQIMRAHELMDLRKTNPKAHDIRKRYHKLYYHFKPTKVYWILVIIARKLGIAVAGLMLRQNPGFQLAVCLCLLFVCYVAQVKHRPFMSTAERKLVCKDHREKVEEYERLKHKGLEPGSQLLMHKRIDGHMKQALLMHASSKANTMRGGVGRVLNAEDSAQENEKEINKLKRPAERTYYFDYNTVEQVLLGSAILVCLSGIMFENERFKERQDLMYQKEVITWIVLCVIFLSILYYSVVFVSEVFAWHPRCLMWIFASKKMRRAMKEKRNEGKRQATRPGFNGDVEGDDDARSD
eukprot:g313.t1